MWLPAQCSEAQTKPGATQHLRASKGGTSQLSRSYRKHFHSPCSSELTQKAPKQGWSESHSTLKQDIVQLLWAHRTQHFQLDDCHSLFPEVHDRAVDSFGWQKLECAPPRSLGPRTTLQLQMFKASTSAEHQVLWMSPFGCRSWLSMPRLGGGRTVLHSTETTARQRIRSSGRQCRAGTLPVLLPQ